MLEINLQKSDKLTCRLQNITFRSDTVKKEPTGLAIGQ
jgi:hypothetical protein